MSDYVIEAGSRSGSTDSAWLPTGDTLTTWAFDGVPTDRTFYIRVRGRSAVGTGPPSNEVRIGPGL